MNTSDLHERVDDYREGIDNLMDEIVKSNDVRFDVVLGALSSVSAILRHILEMEPESTLQETIDALVADGLVKLAKDESS